MISLQTNVNSLVAQQGLSVNNGFQSQAIEQLSSGYRINSSADDAAGLAVANQYQADIVELQQGVRNANDGLSQLQIIDGGLSNISTMLDRMKTLATESATSTFTGSRTTLNDEYGNLIAEITRQADNIQLNAGGNLNTNLNVYVGGARTSDVTGTGLVNINLSGVSNGVDAGSLGLGGTNVLGGDTGSASFTNNNVSNLNDPNARFLSGGGSETFAVSYVNSQGVVSTQNVMLTATSNGFSGPQIVSAINSALADTGIESEIGSNGALQFNGDGLLAVTATTLGGPAAAPVQTGATLLNGANYQATGNFQNFLAGGGGATTESMVVSVNGTSYTINLDSSTVGNTAADNATDAVASLNFQLQGSGVYASSDGRGHVTLQSANSFSVVETNNTPGATGGSAGVGDYAGMPGLKWCNQQHNGTWYNDSTLVDFTNGANERITINYLGTNYNLTLNSADASTQAAVVGDLQGLMGPQGFTVTADGSGNGVTMTAAQYFALTVDSVSNGSGGAGSGYLFSRFPGDIAVTSPTLNNGAGATGNAQSAIAAVNKAVASLGLVQGAVGAGENTLNYAIALAQSQITNYSAAESQIKDADIAAAASSLTKAQVLQQTSIAAMAQANSTPEAVLKLLG